MANKSKTLYTAKTKHKTTQKNIIFEQDLSTMDTINNIIPEQLPVYSSGNLIITTSTEETFRRKFKTDNWISNSVSGSVWTQNVLNNYPIDDNGTDNDIQIKGDYSKLQNFAYYGSCSELIRTSINNIATKFPGELFVDYITTGDTLVGYREYYTDVNGERQIASVTENGGTIFNNVVSNPFKIDVVTKNVTDAQLLENSLKYFAINGVNNYVVIDDLNGSLPIVNIDVTLIGEFEVKCPGDVIALVDINTADETFIMYVVKLDNNEVVYLTNDSRLSWHIRPKEQFLNDFYKNLDTFEKTLLNRYSAPKHKAIFEIIKEDDLGEYKTIETFIFPMTNGGYNLDIENTPFLNYIDRLSQISLEYDEKYSDNLYRSMTHESIKNFDWSKDKYDDTNEYIENGERVKKMLRVFGRGFDSIKNFIDAIENVNTISYDDRNNLSDYFLSDSLNLDGWVIKDIKTLTERIFYINDSGKEIDITNGNCTNRHTVKPIGKRGKTYGIHRTFSQDNLTYKPYSNPTSGYFIMPGCCGEIVSCTGETNGSLLTTKSVEFIEYKGNKLYLNNNVLTINSGEIKGFDLLSFNLIEDDPQIFSGETSELNYLEVGDVMFLHDYVTNTNYNYNFKITEIMNSGYTEFKCYCIGIDLPSETIDEIKNNIDNIKLMLNDNTCRSVEFKKTLDVTESSFGDPLSLNNVKYCGDKFFVVSSGTDKLYSSLDGVNWDESTLPITGSWYSMSYGNGMFISLSYNSDEFIYSYDGIIWNKSTLPTTGNWYSIAYGNGVFVSLSYNSDEFIYSYDGIIWNKSTLPTTGNWRSIAYGNGMFVSLSVNSDEVIYSYDGITWFENYLPEYGQWNSIAYGNGMFVSIKSDNNKALYSHDGIFWTESETQIPSNWYSLSYGNGMFVSVNYYSSKILYSYDAVTWFTVDLENVANWRFITFGINKFVTISSGVHSNRSLTINDFIIEIEDVSYPVKREDILLNRVKSYTSNKTYTSDEINYLFLKHMKLNSKEILRRKGTIAGVEEVLGLFGLKSERFVNLSSDQTQAIDYRITESTLLTRELHEPINKFYKKTDVDWYNSTKTYSYNTFEFKNGVYEPYQGLPVIYDSLYLSGSTLVHEKYDDNGVELPLGSHDIYPYFDKTKQYDGNMYYQMNGGWLQKYPFMFSKDNKLICNEEYFTKTLRDIYMVEDINELVSIPFNRLHDNFYCEINNQETPYMILNGIPYEIKTESLLINNQSIGITGRTSCSYVEMEVDSMGFNIGDVGYLSKIYVSHPCYQDYEKEYDLDELENSIKIKVYLYHEVVSGSTTIKQPLSVLDLTNVTISDVKVDTFMRAEDEIISNVVSHLFVYDSEIYSGYWVLDIVDDYYKIAMVNDELGWKRVLKNSNEALYLDSIITIKDGNNPHSSKTSYDNGVEYINRFVTLFKEPLTWNEFDFRCYDNFEEVIPTISGIGFTNLIVDEQINTLQDTKIHSFADKLLTNGTFVKFGDSGYTLQDIFRYGELKYDDIQSTSSNINRVINTKYIDIEFITNDTNGKYEQRKYIDSVVMNYLEQVLPSNIICRITYKNLN